MGVHDLFKLLEPSCDPIAPNDLKDKVLAVDISVWMHQFIHGTFLNESSQENFGLGGGGGAMDDVDMEQRVEQANVAAYLQNLFLRFCKLWFWGVKIVVVFDGQTPLLKRNTVAKRLKQKRQDEKKLQLVAKKLLKNRLEGIALDRLTAPSSSSTPVLNNEKGKGKGKESLKGKNKERDDDDDDELNFAIDGHGETQTTTTSSSSSSYSGSQVEDSSSSSSQVMRTPEKNKNRASASHTPSSVSSSVSSSSNTLSDIYTDPRNWDFGDEEVDIEAVFRSPMKKGRRTRRISDQHSGSQSTQSMTDHDGLSDDSFIDEAITSQNSMSSMTETAVKIDEDDTHGHVGDGDNDNDDDDDDDDVYVHYDVDDIDEQVFAKLPPSVQQQLLRNIRRLKRHAPASKISTLQTHTPDSFSNAQLSNFIQSRNAHRRLQQIMHEGQEAQQLERYSQLLTPKMEDQLDGMEMIGGRLASDENTEFILLSTPTSNNNSFTSATTTPGSSGRRRRISHSSSTLTSTVTTITNNNNNNSSLIYSGDNDDVYDPDDELPARNRLATSVEHDLEFDTFIQNEYAMSNRTTTTNRAQLPTVTDVSNRDVIEIDDSDGNDDDYRNANGASASNGTIPNGETTIEEDNDDDFESVGLESEMFDRNNQAMIIMNDDSDIYDDDDDDDDEFESTLNHDGETITDDFIARELFPASMFDRVEKEEEGDDFFPASMFEKATETATSESIIESTDDEDGMERAEIVNNRVDKAHAIESKNTEIKNMPIVTEEEQQEVPSVEVVDDSKEVPLDNIAAVAAIVHDEEINSKVTPQLVVDHVQEEVEASTYVDDNDNIPNNTNQTTSQSLTTGDDVKGKARILEIPDELSSSEDEDDSVETMLRERQSIQQQQQPQPEQLPPQQPSAELSEQDIRERELMIGQMRDRLNSEQNLLRRELNRVKKSSQSISEHLVQKTKDLLQALGIPYVQAPYEADSQCGFLCEHGLVDGVVSEDSDMLLFGCKVLYRRMFGREDGQVYSLKRIEERLGLTKRELIQLGMMLGCDYTDGVHGVGIVTGIQICDAFNRVFDNARKEPQSKQDDKLTAEDIIEPLKKFAEWVNGREDMFDDTGGFKYKFRNIKRNFILPPKFPDERIANAFLRPTVDESKEEFKFGTFGSDDGQDDLIGIDIETLYEFGAEHMNWDRTTIDKHLGTLVTAQRRQKASPNKIDYYLSKPTSRSIASEGIKRAVKGLTSKRKREATSNSDGSTSSSSSTTATSASVSPPRSSRQPEPKRRR